MVPPPLGPPPTPKNEWAALRSMETFWIVQLWSSLQSQTYGLDPTLNAKMHFDNHPTPNIWNSKHSRGSKRNFFVGPISALGKWGWGWTLLHATFVTPPEIVQSSLLLIPFWPNWHKSWRCIQSPLRRLTANDVSRSLFLFCQNTNFTSS